MRKAIMKTTQLLNSYHKMRNSETLEAYKKRNHCSRLFEKENLDTTLLINNKTFWTFWRTMKTLFTEKTNNMTKIILLTKNNILFKDTEVENAIDSNKMHPSILSIKQSASCNNFPFTQHSSKNPWKNQKNLWYFTTMDL